MVTRILYDRLVLCGTPSSFILRGHQSILKLEAVPRAGKSTSFFIHLLHFGNREFLKNKAIAFGMPSSKLGIYL